ncbi:MAG TPA: UbiA family prenyltransferase [Anaerolineae bacterium]|nr:UbiA family prenyltransferase [Anaerolineae bacterium]
MKKYYPLFFNHMDAWVTTLLISGIALTLHGAWSERTIVLWLSLVVGYWYAFALNDYFDAPYDRLEAGKGARNFFVGEALSERVLWWGTVAVVGLLLLSYGQFGWRGVLVLGVSLFIMWGYSAPPLRFKRRPGLDVVVHALGVQTYPYWVVLLLLGAEWTVLDKTLWLIFLLASMTAQIEQQLRDYEIDVQFDRTFVMAVGRGRAIQLLRGVTAVMLGVAVWAVWAGVLPAVVAGLGVIASPAMLHRFVRKPGTPRSEGLIKWLVWAALGYGVVVGWFYLGGS